jgi:phospholipid/cholesterol/gamma-HCH transport system permease protein
MTKGLRGYFLLCASMIYWLLIAPFRGKGYRLSQVLAQMVRIGVHAVPMAALTTLTIGLVLAMQSAMQLQSLGAAQYVPRLVASALVRELAPLIVAIIVIGRSGSAVTAELGTMKVSEEIDALEVMAIPPMSFLILPRFLAMILMMPVLTVFGIYVGMFGGWLITYFNLDMSTAYYVSHALDYVEPRDIVITLTKSLVFGFLIVTISCHTGLNVRGGAEGVGLATTRSVVLSLFAVFISNAIVTALFYF